MNPITSTSVNINTPDKINTKAAEAKNNVQGASSKTEQPVTLSPTAQNLSQTTSDFDAQKVELLKSQIADGTYKVDSKLVAEKMVQAFLPNKE